MLTLSVFPLLTTLAFKRSSTLAWILALGLSSYPAFRFYTINNSSKHVLSRATLHVDTMIVDLYREISILSTKTRVRTVPIDHLYIKKINDTYADDGISELDNARRSFINASSPQGRWYFESGT